MGFFKKKKKEGEIKAFATGDIIALKDVKDQMFSAGLMGQGIAIESDDGKFYSPVNGTITMLFPTKHALGIKSDDGYELLLHIGVDTVGLKGEGFTAFVQDGQKVSAGDALLQADLEFIRSKGLETSAILCVTEPHEPEITFTTEERVYAARDVVATIKLSYGKGGNQHGIGSDQGQSRCFLSGVAGGAAAFKLHYVPHGSCGQAGRRSRYPRAVG